MAIIEDPKLCRAVGMHTLRVMLLGTAVGACVGVAVHAPGAGLTLGSWLGALAGGDLVVLIAPLGLGLGAAMGNPVIGATVGIFLAAAAPRWRPPAAPDA